MFDVKKTQPEAPLYRPEFEHDNCGIGACVNIKGIKSRETVENALKIVENLEHRAGKDAEGKTGDGVGILTQIPHRFFKKVTKPLGISIGEEREYGVGMFFFPKDELQKNQAKKMFEIIVEKEGLTFLGWREVPTNPSVLGHKAVECMPHIMQAFVKKPAGVAKGAAFDRLLYVARRVFEQSSDNTDVVSLSSRTIVYKGMFLVGQLRTFFSDLQDKDYESAIAMVHSRFSTNTNPSWERARNQQRNIRLEMADFRCEVCGRPIDNTCHIHRNLPMGAPDRNKADNIRVMCGHCWRELEKKPHIHGYQHIEDTTRYDARD